MRAGRQKLSRIACVDTLAVAALVVFLATAASAQQSQSVQGGAQSASAPTSQQQETLDDSPLEAGDEELATPKKDLVKWNHYDGDFFHIRFGAGYLYEGAAYSQNAASEEQF